MKFTIEIECSNAAFEDYPVVEIARILEEQVKKLRRENMYPHSWSDSLYDINGNKVGTVKLEAT